MNPNPFVVPRAQTDTFVLKRDLHTIVTSDKRDYARGILHRVHVGFGVHRGLSIWERSQLAERRGQSITVSAEQSKTPRAIFRPIAMTASDQASGRFQNPKLP